MTKHRKVIIWGRKDVLGNAFEEFMLARDEWNVVRITDDKPMADFFGVVEKEKPEVIILYEGSCIREPSLAVQLMQMHPKLRVISASLQDNNLEIYDRRKICIKNVTDLFAAIEG